MVVVLFQYLTSPLSLLGLLLLLFFLLLLLNERHKLVNLLVGEDAHTLALLHHRHLEVLALDDLEERLDGQLDGRLFAGGRLLAVVLLEKLQHGFVVPPGGICLPAVVDA